MVGHRDAFESFAWFAAVGLPAGFAFHFITWKPQWRGFAGFIADYAIIFLFVAVAEELFFRGLLQNLLEKTIHSRSGAQALASILFGLSHIRHAPAPNWRYVILASIAGWFYGWAYVKHSLMASATTLALVDTIWRTWLTLRGFEKTLFRFVRMLASHHPYNASGHHHQRDHEHRNVRHGTLLCADKHTPTEWKKPGEGRKLLLC